MSQSPYNQQVTLSATPLTVTNISVPLYYERVIVTNESATGEVFVSTDGSAVATSEGNFGAIIVPGAWRMIGNDQPRQPLVSTTAPGSTTQNKGFQGATAPNLNALASGAPTYVSILSTVASNVVTLEFV